MYRFIDEGRKHLHTLDGKPLLGTSTVVKETIAKPLTWWASGCAVMKFGVPDPKVLTKIKKGEATEDEIATLKDSVGNRFAEILEYDLDETVALLGDAYRAHAESLKDSADEGVDLHALLEEYVKECMKNGGAPMPSNDVRIRKFAEWAIENVDYFLFSEGHCYSERLWVGGIADAGARMKDGKLAVIDFKSAKDAYPDHFLQVALYAIQMAERGVLDAEGEVVVAPITFDQIIIVPFGAKEFTVRNFMDIDGAKAAAEHVVALYKFIQSLN